MMTNSRVDGLSLLGLVCETQLQQEDTRHEVKTENKSEDMYEEVKFSHLLKEETHDGDNCNINPLVKNEPVDMDVLIVDTPGEERCFEQSLRTLEKSSLAVARHLSVESFGNFMFKIFENQFCKYSKYTGWHLQRSCGMMKMDLKFQKLSVRHGPLIVRALLVRKEDTYRHYGVDTICDNHRRDVGVRSAEHVLHPAAGMDAACYFDNSGQRRSLCFQVGGAGADGAVEATIGLKAMCNDSCSTCADPTFKPTESSRDLLLVLTLEAPERGVILARRSVTIWPKAIVRPKDLNKPERRRPKGGAAKLLKKKEWIDKMKSANAFPSVPSQTCLPTSSKSPVDEPNIDTEREKKFNLIMKIHTKNKMPSNDDILDSSISFVVKSAKKGGYSKDYPLKIVSNKFDRLSEEAGDET